MDSLSKHFSAFKKNTLSNYTSICDLWISQRCIHLEENPSRQIREVTVTLLSPFLPSLRFRGDRSSKLPTLRLGHEGFRSLRSEFSSGGTESPRSFGTVNLD